MSPSPSLSLALLQATRRVAQCPAGAQARRSARRAPEGVLAVSIFLVLSTASLALTACGTSSNPSSSSHAANATATATAQSPAAPVRTNAASSRTPAPVTTRSIAAARFNQAFATFASCLRSGGVQLPSPKHGQALSLRGVDTKSATYRGALAKCRTVLSAAFRSAAARPAGSLSSPTKGSPPRTSSPAAPTRIPISAALLAQEKRFSACMRTQGIATFPEPKSGGGWDLAAAHLDTSNPQFRSAESRCSSILDPHSSQPAG